MITSNKSPEPTAVGAGPVFAVSGLRRESAVAQLGSLSQKNDFSHQCLCGTVMIMGAFYVGAKIENVSDRDKGASIPKLLVDTGSEYTWIAGATLE